MVQIGLLYLAVAIALTLIGLKDDPPLTRREMVAVAFAALLWALFHIPWRGSGKHLQKGQVAA